MGTELNLDLLRGMGFDAARRRRAQRPGRRGARRRRRRGRAGRTAAMEQALAAASAGSSGGDGLGGSEPAPRTVASAARRTGGADLALVSVPGPHAFTEAMDALGAGLSVLVFSDNVPVEQEVRLKDEAAARGLLVMGPDCGTAVVGGVGLGFANAVRPGPVGLVAASGTGAQQLMCMLDTREVGVSHCLGVGGRDLSAAVAGRADPRRPRAARRRPGDRADRAGVQAAGPRRRRRDHGVRRVAGHPGAARAARPGPGRPDDRRAAGGRGGRRDLGRAVVLGRAAGAVRRRRCAGCSPAAPCATRRWSSRPPRSARCGPTSRSGPEWAVGAGPALRRRT